VFRNHPFRLIERGERGGGKGKGKWGAAFSVPSSFDHISRERERKKKERKEEEGEERNGQKRLDQGKGC